MDFDFAEHQELLKSSIDRFGEHQYDLAKRMAYQENPSGFSPENWRTLSEMGVVGMPFSEANGGLGAGNGDLIAAFETFGRRLILEPVAENSILAGGVLEAGAHDSKHGQLCAAMAAGDRRVALAHYEHAGRGAPAWCETRAERSAQGGYRLNGVKSAIPYGFGVDAYIVSARESGAVDGEAGLGFYIVDPAQDGVALKTWRMVDGAPCIALTLTNVECGAAAKLNGDGALLRRPLARYFLASAAESLGLMEMMLAVTLDYLRGRRQFGVPLSSFQALQHRLAAQYAALEQSRSLLYWAAAEEDDLNTFVHRVAGARAFIAEASVALGHEAIQMHGGMGVTDELAVTHAHRRAFVLSRFPSDAAASLDTFAKAGRARAA